MRYTPPLSSPFSIPSQTRENLHYSFISLLTLPYPHTRNNKNNNWADLVSWMFLIRLKLSPPFPCSDTLFLGSWRSWGIFFREARVRRS